MNRSFAAALSLGFALLVGACASEPKPENALNIVIGPDGRMTVAAPRGASAEDQAMAAILGAALNGELDEENAEELSEEEIWRKDADGNATHIQSGATCPVSWAGFTRERMTVFRPDGTDVGCNYTKKGSPTVMTFYVYQNTASLDDEIKSTIETMKTRQPVSKETAFSSPSMNGAYMAQTLAYQTADGSEMRTSVLLAQAGAWRLKVRLTCTAADARMAEQTAGLALMGQSDRLRSPRAPEPAQPPI